MRSKDNMLRKFVASIDDAVALLDARSTDRPVRGATHIEPLPSLLEQCRQMSEEARKAEPEPIRTIHHLACTGGTLIAKCIASLPNTQVLSEVDPLSAIAHVRPQEYSPTDLIKLLQDSSRPVDNDLLINVFLGGMDVAYKGATRHGIRMILRDHAHSHFCFGEDVQDRPSLREIVAQNFNLRSVVTVRHPLDSYLSLMNNGWLHFQPASFNEYCRRYHRFLDHYKNIDLYRYEDFIADPKEVLKDIAASLELPFDESFVEIFSAHRLSGDSGRSGSTISARPRRAVPNELNEEVEQSDNYKSLCDRLDYKIADEKTITL